MVVLRRRIKNDIALTAKKGKERQDDQLVLALPHDEVQACQASCGAVAKPNFERQMSATP